MFKRIRSERGFTLVELLVVLAILAILVAVVVPNLTGLLGGTTTTAMNQEKDVVLNAIDTYNTQDVAIQGGDAILEMGTATTIDPDNPGAITFAKYLRRKTKYSYTWDAGGDNLTVSNP